MSSFKRIVAGRGWTAVSITFVAVFAVGGYFYPILGLGVFGLMAVALAMNFRSRRSFCAGACPNGTFLAAALKPVSRKSKLPAALTDPQFRKLLCGLMMFCMIGLLVRGYPDLSSIGKAFWTIYVLAVSVGVVVGLLFKPRAWCAFCPMGTLQDTIRGAAKKG